MRFIPALSGSLLVPVVYNLLLQLKINRWVSAMGALFIIIGKKCTYPFSQKNYSLSLLF
jgi:dolichyl-phosphate-mannose--protein O-mannosyl transferase